MRPRITLHTFRKVAKLDEMVMRAMMPRTAAASPRLPLLHSGAALRPVRPLAPLSHRMQIGGAR